MIKITDRHHEVAYVWSCAVAGGGQGAYTTRDVGREITYDAGRTDYGLGIRPGGQWERHTFSLTAAHLAAVDQLLALCVGPRIPLPALQAAIRAAR